MSSLSQQSIIQACIDCSNIVKPLSEVTFCKIQRCDSKISLSDNIYKHQDVLKYMNLLEVCPLRPSGAQAARYTQISF